VVAGLARGRIHDYTRTTSLFAALEVASGNVHARCFCRHRHNECIAFLNSLSGLLGREHDYVDEASKAAAVSEEFVTKTAASVSEADERLELGSPTTAGWSVTIVSRASP
jgi:hypothetical protein